MKRQEIQIRETAATVIAEEAFIPLAEAEISRQRSLIEEFIRQDPQFRTSLEPYPVSSDAPAIVRRMAGAASRAGVGPMAAVAGAIAEFALNAMIRAGAAHAIVDNGGDIAMRLSRPATVGIFAGPAKIRNIGLRFQPRPGIVGVCTSSGTVGHSLSFGRADAATVIAGDVCLADAVATALGNAVREKNSAQIEEALNRFLIDGVEGLLVIIDDLFAIAGRLPEIVEIPVDPGKISKGTMKGEIEK
ncbi:MAG: UPF0280 family protein [Candidatus Aminicenantales bacterium]